MANIMTSQARRNSNAAPSADWPDIGIHIMDIVQPPGIVMPPAMRRASHSVNHHATSVDTPTIPQRATVSFFGPCSKGVRMADKRLPVGRVPVRFFSPQPSVARPSRPSVHGPDARATKQTETVSIRGYSSQRPGARSCWDG